MDAVKVAMKFYRWKEGLSLHYLNARRIWGFCWGVSSSTPQIADYRGFIGLRGF